MDRLIAVGEAGSLEAAPEVPLVDTPDFPDFIKPIALPHREALEIYFQETELNWAKQAQRRRLHRESGRERIGRIQTGLWSWKWRRTDFGGKLCCSHPC